MGTNELFPGEVVITYVNKQSFHVVIVGSNGYSKTPVPAPNANANFTVTTALPGSVNAPLDYGVDTYIGMKTYTSS
jgi:hypothetical protein